MGKSDKVKELQATDQNFSTMMTTMEESLNETADKQSGIFEDEIQKFYGDNFKFVTIMEAGEHRDYQLQMDFSMSQIGDVIRTTGEEVFGRITTSEKSKDQQEIVSSIQPYYDFAISAATSILTDVLTLLSWSQSADYQIEAQHKSVGPGLTMHLLILSKAFQGSTSTENKAVLQNYIRYKIIFSPQKAGVEMDIAYLLAQEKEFDTKTKKYESYQEKLDKIYEDDAYYDEDDNGPLHRRAHNYEGLLTDLHNARQQAYNAVQNLVKQYKADGPVDQLPHAALKHYLGEHGYLK